VVTNLEGASASSFFFNNKPQHKLGAWGVCVMSSFFWLIMFVASLTAVILGIAEVPPGFIFTFESAFLVLCHLQLRTRSLGPQLWYAR
jgi:hypothetical protein